MDLQLNRTNGSPHQELSYAQNSAIQANSISKTLHITKDALEGLYSTMKPKCVTIAELGCAYGPNTLMIVPELIRVTIEKFKEKEVPKMHVPDDLFDKDGASLLKGYMYIVETSPPEACIAYQKQFATDFTAFLKCPGEEVIEGGRMIINIMLTSETHGPHQFWIIKLMNMVIHDMLKEGLVDEEKANNFNMPFYPPTVDEVNKLVVDQGSFFIDKHETFSVLWDVPMLELRDGIDELKRARFVAGPAIAVAEYMISENFGEGVAKEFFRRFIELVRKFLSAGDKFYTFHQVVSLIRK
ncbi:7-methylxanthosine synthase 1-like [Chenopodium quinoa]|uniref:Uncharacterized protein n=1 Tax=Chenopodium quinoa TaxID=63459 RepID=A0A803MD30_CHEQI|nr:7-methylxanthosine synthase 1-like [Chenopodium quinoa]